MTEHALARMLAGLVLLVVLGWLSVIDLRTRRLPDLIVLPTLWLGLVLNAATGLFTTPENAILGTILGYASLQALAAAYAWRAPGGRAAAAFGGGDLKLAALLGAWLGAPSVVAALLIAFVAGTCTVLPLVVSGRYRLREQVPFGPALATGGVAALIAGPALPGILFGGI
ncbi:MAG: prepilin peptidase [Acidisphaera sp.]|nr:prepilin peptidase [Acidisphaera sp.]